MSPNNEFSADKCGSSRFVSLYLAPLFGSQLGVESILNQDRNVLSCVVFGRGKPQAGDIYYSA